MYITFAVSVDLPACISIGGAAFSLIRMLLLAVSCVSSLSLFRYQQISDAHVQLYEHAHKLTSIEGGTDTYTLMLEVIRKEQQLKNIMSEQVAHAYTKTHTRTRIFTLYPVSAVIFQKNTRKDLHQVKLRKLKEQDVMFGSSHFALLSFCVSYLLLLYHSTQVASDMQIGQTIHFLQLCSQKNTKRILAPGQTDCMEAQSTRCHFFL